MLLIVLVLTVYPRPPAPYDYLPYIFAAAVMAGILISVLRSLRQTADGNAQCRLGEPTRPMQ
jgi:hypothetical protein